MFDLDVDGRLNASELKDMLHILNFVARNHNSCSGPTQNQPSIQKETSIETESELLFPHENKRLSIELERTLWSLKDHLSCCDTEEGDLLPDLGTVDSSGTAVEPNGCPVVQDLVKGNNYLSLEEFVIWAVPATSLVNPMLELLFQVCHVSLGLRPRCRHHERDIVLGWLRREERRGYRIGQFWYLASSKWWKNWLNYTGFQTTGVYCQGCGHRAPSPAQQSPADRSVEEGIVCDESFTSNSTESMGDLLRGGSIYGTAASSNNGDTCSIASSSGVSSSSGSGMGGSNTGNGKKTHATIPPGKYSSRTF